MSRESFTVDAVDVVETDGVPNSSFGPALEPPQSRAVDAVDVVESDGGPNSLANSRFGPALEPPQSHAVTARRGVSGKINARRVIDGNVSSEVQDSERCGCRFACHGDVTNRDVGDCSRRCRDIDRLCTSLSPLRPCYLIVSS